VIRKGKSRYRFRGIVDHHQVKQESTVNLLIFRYFEIVNFLFRAIRVFFQKYLKKIEMKRYSD